jgi:hypothetical protein
VVDEGVCFLALCAKSYPSRLCFAFLDDIRDGFFADLKRDYGQK